MRCTTRVFEAEAERFNSAAACDGRLRSARYATHSIAPLAPMHALKPIPKPEMETLNFSVMHASPSWASLAAVLQSRAARRVRGHAAMRLTSGRTTHTVDVRRGPTLASCAGANRRPEPVLNAAQVMMLLVFDLCAMLQSWQELSGDERSNMVAFCSAFARPTATRWRR